MHHHPYDARDSVKDHGFHTSAILLSLQSRTTQAVVFTWQAQQLASLVFMLLVDVTRCEAALVLDNEYVSGMVMYIFSEPWQPLCYVWQSSRCWAQGAADISLYLSTYIRCIRRGLALTTLGKCEARASMIITGRESLGVD